MNNSTKKIYEYHHKTERREGFSIMKEERGKFFKEAVGKGKKVLDIGCRDGALTKYFIESNNVLGADIDENSLNRASQELGIRTLLIDLNDDWQELKDEKFDVITAGEIIEHLYYPEKVIKKVACHLNKNGIFIGSVPNAFSFKNRARYILGKKKNTPLEDPTHINHFNYLELERLLKKYFNKVEIIGMGRFSKLARIFPNYFAFIFVFKASEIKYN